MALVLLGTPELGVGAVEPVEDAEDPETLVEPGDRKKITEAAANCRFH